MLGYIVSIAINSMVVRKAFTVSTPCMNVQTVPSAALFHRDRHFFWRPATDGPNRVGWMRTISEDYRFIGGVHQGLIPIDECRLFPRVQLA